MEANEIIDVIKAKHGTVSQFAANTGIRRENIYKAVKGLGNINVRLTIARMLDKKPSEIWPNRSTWIKNRDDLMFSNPNWQVYL